MMRTVVCQSFCATGVPPWIERCLASVRDWSALRAFDYRFVDDALLGLVPDWYREKADGVLPIVTDLARLRLIQALLAGGYERAIWLDADVLIFDPNDFEIGVTAQYAFGREIWVQSAGGNRLRTYRNVHNALTVFVAGNDFLDFYAHACEAIVGRHRSGGMAPQIVGTKLLTALHNLIGFALVDDVAMFSPLVVRDVTAGGGAALERLCEETPGRIRAANLCASLVGRTVDGVAVAADLLDQSCDRLLERGLYACG